MPGLDAEHAQLCWELYVMDLAGSITTASVRNPQVSSVAVLYVHDVCMHVCASLSGPHF